MAFSYTVFFIDMSSVRWRSTADVANPRPREVGGACRRQVLAGARTQETVGGPNGTQRSELRRTPLPDNERYRDQQMIPDMSYKSPQRKTLYGLIYLIRLFGFAPLRQSSILPQTLFTYNSNEDFSGRILLKAASRLDITSS